MKTNLDKIYKTNSSNEKEGKWIPVSDEVQFLIKRYGGANSQAVKQANAKYVKPYVRQIQKGILPEEIERKIYIKTFVDVSMVDWKGIEDENGVVEFSKEAAVDLFTQLPELFDDIIDIARDFETFRDDLGKS